MNARYVVRPKADRDLDDQAYYLATEASSEVGHRFLVAGAERLFDFRSLTVTARYVRG